MKQQTLLVVLLSSSVLTSASLHAADAGPDDEKLVMSGEFFNDAPHWISATTLSQSDGALSATKDLSGEIILTPKAVKTDFEDTKSHIMSKEYYSDKMVSMEFLITPNSMTDVLLFGRFPIRLSEGDEAKTSFNSPGAIGKFWDEWNKDNPNRSYGGSLPSQAMSLAPNEWHTLEATVRAPRYDEGHNKINNALIMSVKINGVELQRNIIADAPSQNATFHWEERNGPLVFDTIAGQAAIRNITVSRANFDLVELPQESGGETNAGQLVNLVEQGKTAFKNYGCAECHSIKANDSSVKTGPNLYALFTREPRKRTVQNQEKHEYQVRADNNYLKRSIRNAEAEMAIAESGSNQGKPYLPIMPNYKEQTIPDKDISAIYSFLLSRNDLWNQGPLVRLESPEGPVEYQPMQDPMQFMVQERIRIQRGPMPELSGRAIHVGQPQGIHYSFDPRNLAVSKIWQGGFLETSGELSGRGGNGFEIGYQAIELNLGEFGGLLRPINAAGNLIDFSFKSTKFKDMEAINETTYSTQSFEERLQEQDARFKGYFRDSTKPLAPVSFFYEVGNNTVGITHSINADGNIIVHIQGTFSEPQSFALNQQVLKNVSVNAGDLVSNTWVIPANKQVDATLMANINTVETPWSPESLDFTYEQQDFETATAEANLPPGYSIENWYAPKDNLGREQLFEAIGIDALDSGDVLVSTRTAGVWKVKDGKWQLFAEGIFDSLGVLSENADGSVAVVGNKAELTRIRDINADGIADYYDTLFDAFTNASNYHAYMHGPTRDKDGNYVIAINLADSQGKLFNAGGGVMGSHGGYVGWGVRISPSGEHEYFVNGLRSPAGLGSDPNGNIWYADNQGDFVGSSKIFMLEDGKFYGHPASLIDEPGMTPDSNEIKWEQIIERKEKEVITVAHGKVANSLGNPVWDTTAGKFGPYAGQMFIGDQTQSNLTRATYEQVNGQWQGVMIPFASGMESGVMRPVFMPDASLLLGQTGRGWQAKGGNAAALQRLIYNGKTIPLHIQDVSITTDGFTLSLTRALPEAITHVALKGALSVNSWTYRDAPAYGSEEMGANQDAIADIRLSDDKQSIDIVLAKPEIPDIHPQQTARIFHIQLKSDELEEVAGTDSLDAFYSAYSFKE